MPFITFPGLFFFLSLREFEAFSLVLLTGCLPLCLFCHGLHHPFTAEITALRPHGG